MSGYLDKNFIFISDYILSFSSPQILLNEKNILLKNSFSDYLKYRHIEKPSSYKLPLTDENNNTIGEIMLIPKNQTNNETKASIPALRKKTFESNSNAMIKKITSKNELLINLNLIIKLIRS